MSIFLTNGTWNVTQSAIKVLWRNNVKVIVGDTNQFIFGLHSRYCSKFVTYLSPKNEAFISSLYNIIKDIEADVLVPMSNDTVFQITKYKKLFEEITIVPFPDHEIMLKAYDKLKTARSAEELNIPTPRTYFFNNEDELESFSEITDYPLIVKPRMGGGASTGLFLVDSPEKLISAYTAVTKEYGSSIIQEYIPGKSEQMHMVNVLLNRNSKPAVLFTAKKIREYPVTGGITTCGISTWEPDLMELSVKLLENWGWYGPAEVEFKIDPRDEKPKLIEVNPRFWQYLQLPIACGIEFPYLLYKIALDENIKPMPRYKIGMKYINPLKDMLSMLTILLNSRGNPKTALSLFDSYRGDRTYSFSLLDDPMPAIGKIISTLYKKKE